MQIRMFLENKKKKHGISIFLEATASLNSVNCAEKFHRKLNHCYNAINNFYLTHSAFTQKPKSKPSHFEMRKIIFKKPFQCFIKKSQSFKNLRIQNLLFSLGMSFDFQFVSSNILICKTKNSLQQKITKTIQKFTF